MPFELIMLLGFFGTVLFSLLPAAPAKAAEDNFRGRCLQRRSDREHGRGRVARQGQVTGSREAIRRRREGRAAA